MTTINPLLFGHAHSAKKRGQERKGVALSTPVPDSLEKAPAQAAQPTINFAGRIADRTKKAFRRLPNISSRAYDKEMTRKAGIIKNAARMLGAAWFGAFLVGAEPAKAQAQQSPVDIINSMMTLTPSVDPLRGRSIDDIIANACRADDQSRYLQGRTWLGGTSGLLSDPEEVSTRMYQFLSDNVVKVRTPDGTGSGWYCGDPNGDPAKGFIVTNAHVSGDNATVELTSKSMSGNPVIGRVVAVHKAEGGDDITLISISEQDRRRLGIQSIPLARLDEVAGGRTVHIGGFPFGDFAVTRGQISDVSARVPGSFGDMVKVDASVNPGNSGGAGLVAVKDRYRNAPFRLAGIPTEIFSMSGGFEGTGYLKNAEDVAVNITLARAGIRLQRDTIGVYTANGSEIMEDVEDAIDEISPMIAMIKPFVDELQQDSDDAKKGDLEDPDAIAYFNSIGLDPSSDDPKVQQQIIDIIQQYLDYYSNLQKQLEAQLKQFTDARDWFTQNPPEPGVYVLGVVPGSRAEKAGIKQYDRLVMVDGMQIRSEMEAGEIFEEDDWAYRFNMRNPDGSTGFVVQIERKDNNGNRQLWTGNITGTLQQGTGAASARPAIGGWLNWAVPRNFQPRQQP